MGFADLLKNRYGPWIYLPSKHLVSDKPMSNIQNYLLDIFAIGTNTRLKEQKHVIAAGIDYRIFLYLLKLSLPKITCCNVYSFTIGGGVNS